MKKPKSTPKEAIELLADWVVDDVLRDAEKGGGKPRRRTRLNRKGATRLLEKDKRKGK